ncbi:CRTAC1 family protein [Lignipirellula cremea]|uniref:FG-GAP repeat protein n=1 Tax=Lignipirellula cremea TaxID=2528010 RepID=A0A518E177_9BACT|nr:CRTAC1 family protein [Lignipirellula cremea]QDU97849.1 FG-GAP repeat protein [Lignipirellula cremea]
MSREIFIGKRIALHAGLLLLGWATLATAADPFQFRDVASEVGLTKPLQGMMAHAAAWGDVDQDGKLDLFVGSFADRKIEIYQAGGATGPVPNQLLMQRDGKFVAVKNADVAWMGRATGAAFADFDNDGWNDLYVTNNGKLGKENLLYRNNKGKLELATDETGAPLELPETARGFAVLDFNGDGLLDLFVVATVNSGEASKLFQNMGEMKFKLSKALPADVVGLGVAVGDLTGNGWPDVYVGGSNRLFINRGRGRYREATEFQLGDVFKAEDAADSCGVAMGDFDRDGQLDIVVGTHTKRPWGDPVAVRLLRNAGSTVDAVQLVDVTKQVGLKPLPMKAPHVEIRDFDNDGWPEIYTSIVTFEGGRSYPEIFKNHGAKGNKLPQFEETAFIHQPKYPEQEDFHPGMSTGGFYEQLAAGGKVMYHAPGPSSDYDNDGRLDLLLPSWFSTRSTQLLRNETPSGGYVDVEVIGADGINRNGVGAVVRAYPAGQALTRNGAMVASEQIAIGYGYASGQAPVAHLGLGDLKACDLIVTLPHGKGQIIKRNVPANTRLKIDASEAARQASLAAMQWPPMIAGASNGVATVSGPALLKIPPQVAAEMKEVEGYAPFVMAKTPPKVEVQFPQNLGEGPLTRRLWSSWGDICLASDGSVYIGIGDHHHDSLGDGRCFIYRWDPKTRLLTQIVDMNQVVLPQPGQPAWSKVHAKIDEGPDGKIYFCCTLNAGNDAGNPKYQWTERLPGAQIYQYDPETGKTIVFANMPPKRCTATSLYDAERKTWWCNLEAGKGDALYGLNLETGKLVYQGVDGEVGFNRNFALGAEGQIYFNGPAGNLQRLDPATKKTTDLKFSFPDESPGMRASTGESKRGEIYGATYRTSQLFSLNTKTNKVKMLGPTWGVGEYTTMMLLSPDEKYVYYLPGAHGQAFRYGTPVVQYEIATGVRKVLAFLAPAMEEQIDYVPGGTYGVKISDDGSTLYVNFNGHPADAIRPAMMRPIGFGLCSFAVINIPASER